MAIDNYGGLSKVLIAAAADISINQRQLEQGAVSLTQAAIDAAFTQVQHILESAGYEHGESTGPDGTVHDMRLQWRTSKYDQAAIATAVAWRKKQLVSLGYDHNGQVWLFGSAQYPLMLAHDMRTGQRVSELNYVQYILEGSSEFGPAYVTIS